MANLSQPQAAMPIQLAEESLDSYLQTLNIIHLQSVCRLCLFAVIFFPFLYCRES